MGAKERATQIEELETLLEKPPVELVLRTYSLVGTKSGVHGLLWMIAPQLEVFQAIESRILARSISGFLDFPYSYLGMSRRSQYVRDHSHPGQEGSSVRPQDRRYLFVYPFVKKREWYALPFERRRSIMAEHMQIGHRFPGVEIHTGYSFGLDDAEFILAFEADSPGEFLDLVQALRTSEASRYTALETPIFTAIRAPPRRTLELAAGLS